MGQAGIRPHEAESVRRFTRVLNPRERVKLVLLSRWRQMDVPGFDGLVVDHLDHVVANFSLKTMPGRDLARQREVIKKGLRGVRAFAQPSGCDAYLATILARRSPSADASGRVRRAVTEMKTIFAVEKSRPSWLLFDSSRPTSALAAAIDALAITTRETAPERIPVLTADALISIANGLATHLTHQ